MNAYQHHQRHLTELSQRYPQQFESGDAISCSWPDGWHPIVSDVCQQVDKVVPATLWVQIKEKFGGLRMYFKGGPFFMDNVVTASTFATIGGESAQAKTVSTIVSEASECSMQTCMYCGEPGTRENVGGWLVTACPQCLRRRRLDDESADT